MDLDQRWLNRDPKTMVETFHLFQECFNFIVEDVLNLPAQRGVCRGIPFATTPSEASSRGKQPGRLAPPNA